MYELTDAQQAAVDAILEGKNVFLTGEAGTGKSVTLREAVRKLEEAGISVLVCAPTGIAAQNAGGETINSAFGFGYAPKVADELWKLGPSETVGEADVIIVDEVGMVRRDTMDAITYVIHKENERRKKDESNRRNLQLVVVGDFTQLPPVTTREDRDALVAVYGPAARKSSFYAFEARGWRHANFETHVLSDPQRQSDPEFIKNLNLARAGDAACLDYFNQFTIEKRGLPPATAVRLVGTNKAAEETNEERLAALDGPAVEFKAHVEGDVKNGDMAAPKSLVLKEGAYVIMVANDASKAKLWVNGTTGTVRGINEHMGTVHVSFNNGANAIVGMNDWDKIKYTVTKEVTKVGDKEVEEQKLKKKVVGRYTQIPLKLAWALTIHKSQGQTIDRAVIDPKCFAHGQLYTALSRLTSAEGLWLTRPIEASDLKADPVVLRFYKRLEEGGGEKDDGGEDGLEALTEIYGRLDGLGKRMVLSMAKAIERELMSA